MISPLVAFRAAAASLPLALIALGSTAMASTSQEQMTATLICRPALTTESADAKLMQSPGLIVCKPFAVEVRSDDGSLQTIGSVTVKPASGPNFSDALTAEQINDAYTAWVRETFHIDPAREHTN